MILLYFHTFQPVAGCLDFVVCLGKGFVEKMIAPMHKFWKSWSAVP